MIKVIPQMPYYKQITTSRNTCITFASTHFAAQSNQQKDSYQQKTQSQNQSTDNTLNKKVAFPLITNPIKFPWIKDKKLINAVNKLNKLEFDKDDVKHVQSLGAVLPFFSGKEAVKFIEDSHIEVKFAPMPSENTHAQYDFKDNCIKINELYRNTQNPAEILAISEAILHEVGHAKDQDGESSLQEEMDCLAMNALAHRTFSKNYPGIFANSNSLIVNDGVAIYSDLFFDPNPSNSALIKRLNIKYGHLPVGDFKHPPSNVALQSKN